MSVQEKLRSKPQWGSGFETFACWVAAAVVSAVCLSIIGYLVFQGWHSLSWKFFTTDPSESMREGAGGGVRVPIVGTALLIVLSVLVMFPIAVGAATYLSEYMDESSWFTRVVRTGLEVLASVPSVVFGMFGLALFSMPIFTFLSSSGAQGASQAFGRSFLVAAIVMGVHVLPFVIKVSEESIRGVPVSYRRGAHALGITKWRSIRKVVLPAAAPGIVTAVILGMGLIAGDTAIVWLLLGGTTTMGASNWWAPSQFLQVLRGTGATLTTYIFFNSPAGDGNSPQLAYAAALVLVVLVLALNVIASIVGRRRKRQGS